MLASQKTIALFTGAAALVSLVGSLTGCPEPAKPPPSHEAPDAGPAVDAAPAATTTNEVKPDPKSEQTGSIVISDEILQACGLPAPSALFAFDSATLSSSDAATLASVVTCFTTGPLKGRTVRLVGHTDPRGTSEYNDALGQSRADSVANYLKSKGMSKERTESTTRGATDAKGTDEATWKNDRNVDMKLVPAAKK